MWRLCLKAIPGPAATQVLADAAAESSTYSSTGEMIKGRMPEPQGACAPKGGTRPDRPDRHPAPCIPGQPGPAHGNPPRLRELRIGREVLQRRLPEQVRALRTALETPSIGEQISQVIGVANPDLVRSFTAGNLGIGSTYGLTPFNLLAPSRSAEGPRHREVPCKPLCPGNPAIKGNPGPRHAWRGVETVRAGPAMGAGREASRGHDRRS